MSGFFRAAILGIVAALVITASAAAQDYALVRARTLFEQLNDEAQCEAALPEARTFWASTEFRRLDDRVRGAVLGAIVICAWRLEDRQVAIAAANASREFDPGWADRTRVGLGISFEDHALAVQAFNDLMQSNPGALSDFDDDSIWRLLRSAERADESGAAELAVHNALEQQKYEMDNLEADEAIRFDHAQALLRAGQVERARARIGEVLDPRRVLAMRVMRLFDPLRENATFAHRLDMRAAAEAHLARLQAETAQNPGSLETIASVSQALRALGREQEALAVMEVALAKAATNPAAFEDQADQINWAHNEHGYVLYALNRPDEARAAFSAAIAVGEGGQWNVSQVINFASMLESEGRARDALEVLRTVGRASVYGDMWTASVRACAAEQIGEVSLRDESMAFLRANEVENPAALSSALLCVNDLEGSAALFVRRLGNPQQAEGALLALQRARHPETTPRVRNLLMEERLDQVRARADVQAAVAAVGRIEDVPLYPVYWGDI